jgi:hypothetical protein
MISWLGSGASPPIAPHPGGERPGNSAHLGLSFAKLKRARAGCVVVVKAVPELQPSNWPPCPLTVPGKEAFPWPMPRPAFVSIRRRVEAYFGDGFTE